MHHLHNTDSSWRVEPEDRESMLVGSMGAWGLDLTLIRSDSLYFRIITIRKSGTIMRQPGVSRYMSLAPCICGYILIGKVKRLRYRRLVLQLWTRTGVER